MAAFRRCSAFVLLLTVPGLCRAEPLPLDVSAGRCRFTVRTESAGAQFGLVVGSLAPAGQTVRVRVQTEASAGPEELPPYRLLPPGPRDKALREQAAAQERVRRQRGRACALDARPPERSRVFHLFVRDRGLDDPAQYVGVVGDLRAVGRHVQVYVDRAEPHADELGPTIAAVIKTFDEDVHPWACTHLGRVRDVDRDGRFSVLLTPWLGKMQNGRTSLDGFVRGSDFYLDLASPFSNRCDMMYLNSRLRPGPYLRTLLAHEYTHAVVFCEHVFESYLPGAKRQDEEGWLNEGLAHVVESLHRCSWGNLDHRVSAFLNAPERYPLVVPDYYRAGLWRTPGTRGSAFLFLRGCHDRIGDELLPRLVQSNLHGTANLEAATGASFAELFRRWTVSLAEGPPSCVRSGGGAPFERLCPGPRHHPLALSGAACEYTVEGTAPLYLQLHSPGSTFARVTVTGDAGQPLQVTLIRLPADRPRLSLDCERTDTSNRVRLALTAHGGAVRLEAACWERLAPRERRAEDTSYRAGEADRTASDWFGRTAIEPGGAYRSGVIALPDDFTREEILFKVTGRDGRGRVVTAWAVWPATGRTARR